MSPNAIASLNKWVKPSLKPTLPIGWHWFTTLLVVQAYNLSSELPTPTALSRIKNVVFISSGETEQRYLRRVLHFNRQNLMLINNLQKNKVQYVINFVFESSWELVSNQLLKFVGVKLAAKKFSGKLRKFG